MTQFVVIGTHPDNEKSVGVGPFRSYSNAVPATEELEGKGYAYEIIELMSVRELIEMEELR